MLIISLLFGFRKFLMHNFNQKRLLENERLDKEKLTELNRLKLQFFTNISHEFRTPLSLILGPLDKILASNEASGKMKKSLSLINRNAKILLSLISELMDFRKLETGKMTLSPTKKDIVKFVSNAGKTFKPIAKNKNINFEINSQIEAHKIWFDKAKLIKIIYNLLSNAFNYTPENGKIKLNISKKPLAANAQLKNKLSIYKGKKPIDEFVEISVEDNGVGISEQSIKLIFDRFYQIEGSQSSNHLGSGVGLALVKNLVLLHSGDIFVHSERSIGTRFTIRLPLGDSHLDKKQKELNIDENTDKNVNYELENIIFKKEIEDESSSMPTQKAAKSSANVLIVEDNNDFRKFMKESLEMMYGVKEAKNGLEGFQTACKLVPDIVISDVMMPEMDGIEFCKKLKTDIRTSHIPVIMLTARTSREHTIEGLETGADIYMTKPLDFKILEINIKNLIESRHLSREHYTRGMLNKPNDLKINSVDEKFMHKVIGYIEDNLSEINLTVESLGKAMGMSRSNLLLKIKALTGQAPNEFIRTIRLNHAAQLLVKSGLNVVEVAYKTGFNSPSYFSKCFRKQFNQQPSDYIKSHQQ